MSQTSKGNGVQYSSFHEQQLLPLTITAELDWVLDVIGNRITGISDEGVGVIEHDLEVQLEGVTPDLIAMSNGSSGYIKELY